jgi:hypothetical protein
MMEVRVALETLTVRVALLLVMPEREAEILDVPAAMPIDKPPDAMVATVVLLLAQVTDEVMF